MPGRDKISQEIRGFALETSDKIKRLLREVDALEKQKIENRKSIPEVIAQLRLKKGAYDKAISDLENIQGEGKGE